MLRLTPILGVAVSVLSVSLVSAADWTRFRGPNGTGVAAADVPPQAVAKNLLWKVVIPGTGHSSPIIVGHKVFLQSATSDGAKRTLICLNTETGQIEWTRDVVGQTAHTHKKNSLASSTPASDGQNVYVLFWDGAAVTLHAFTIDGKPVWAASLGSYQSQHGVGASPVVVGDKVIVNFDQDGAAEAMAFDAKTGAKAWTVERKPSRANPATPMIRTLPGGKQEVVFVNTSGLTGYDPDTGKVNWEWDWAPNKLRTVASPIQLKDSILVVAGDGGGSRAAAVVIPGASPKLLWAKRKDVPYVPTPLVKGDHIYMVLDTGFISCLDAKSGEILWSERVFTKAVTSSPILVGDTVLAIAEDGKVVTFKTDPELFEKVSERSLGEAVFASPAAGDGKVFVRGVEHLFCFGKK
ncbi:MAG: PQQ-binding-like beta-propeller repeat protein [Bacteroidales bacterium]|nr:PQQ-binding-like beta-propeller repeat protein [Bacteroidales bacterium]